MYIPAPIRAQIDGQPYTLDSIGMSGARILCFPDKVLKISPLNEEAEDERRMMDWLSGRLPVPKLLDALTENRTSYLLMSRLEGEMACSQEHLAHPRRLARLLAEGLRMLWRTDTAGCPCHQPLDERLRRAGELVRREECDMEHVELSTYGPDGFENPAALLEWLIDNRPAEEDLVLSHGDFCLPNLFVRDGRISGFLDLGRCGTADRYQDIALCWRSLRDNIGGIYGPVREGFDPDCLFDELGIEPDREKLRYFLLLDELF